MQTSLWYWTYLIVTFIPECTIITGEPLDDWISHIKLVSFHEFSSICIISVIPVFLLLGKRRIAHNILLTIVLKGSIKNFNYHISQHNNDTKINKNHLQQNINIRGQGILTAYLICTGIISYSILEVAACHRVMVRCRCCWC